MRRPSRPEKGAPSPIVADALLRGARECAGLSVRRLAGRMKCSPATIIDAESGGDPRASTLAKYLAALPTLSSHALLGAVAPPPRALPAAWAFVRSVLGFSIRRLVFQVDIVDGDHRTTSLLAEGVLTAESDFSDEATRSRVMQLLLRGSHGARLEAADRAGDLDASDISVRDGAFTHLFSLSGTGPRATLSYRREQQAGAIPPPGTSASGSLALAGPFTEGASLAIEHAVERLDLVVRLPRASWQATARPGAWTDLQTVTPEQPDFLPRLHAGGVEFTASRRAGSYSLTVDRPVFGLYYGIGWGADAEPPLATISAGAGADAPPRPGEAIRAARVSAGLSQRELAARIHVSPATIALAERGQDQRRSHLVRLIRALPALTPDALVQATAAPRELTRREAWEYWRQLLGVEADEERKTLVITPEGDAHAVCETLRLRRVRPGGQPMRVRYSSVQALGRRLPTVLKAIEEAVAAEAEDSGLKARVIARREGRLIHEIGVPARLAQVGASYSRRLFNAGFFDPRAEAVSGVHYDGAAIVPFHPVRRLRLAVTLPQGRWPQQVFFGVHPRMMLDGPIDAVDATKRLHPEGLVTTRDPSTRTLTLSVDWPLVGFMYDVFWAS